MYACKACSNLFSETKNTALAGLRTDMDTITKVMSSLNDGMSINATSRIFQISRNTVRSWLDKLGNTVIILSVSTFC